MDIEYPYRSNDIEFVYVNKNTNKVNIKNDKRNIFFS